MQQPAAAQVSGHRIMLEHTVTVDKPIERAKPALKLAPAMQAAAHSALMQLAHAGQHA
jgi:hypothetical protein